MTVRPRTEPVFYVKVAPEGGGTERVDLSDKVLSFQFDETQSNGAIICISCIGVG